LFLNFLFLLYLIVEEGFAKSATIVEGEFEIGNQYHVYMETLAAVCYPTEDGIEVYCTSQDITAVQTAVASCLNLLSSQYVGSIDFECHLEDWQGLEFHCCCCCFLG